MNRWWSYLRLLGIWKSYCDRGPCLEVIRCTNSGLRDGALCSKNPGLIWLRHPAVFLISPDRRWCWYWASKNPAWSSISSISLSGYRNPVLVIRILAILSWIEVMIVIVAREKYSNSGYQACLWRFVYWKMVLACYFSYRSLFYSGYHPDLQIWGFQSNYHQKREAVCHEVDAAPGLGSADPEVTSHLAGCKRCSSGS